MKKLIVTIEVLDEDLIKEYEADPKQAMRQFVYTPNQIVNVSTDITFKVVETHV